MGISKLREILEESIGTGIRKGFQQECPSVIGSMDGQC